MKGKGCRECRGPGYRGRKAIAELLDAERRDARADHRARAGAQPEGRGGGEAARASCARRRSMPVRRGETTLQEINRVTFVA